MQIVDANLYGRCRGGELARSNFRRYYLSDMMTIDWRIHFDCTLVVCSLNHINTSPNLPYVKVRALPFATMSMQKRTLNSSFNFKNFASTNSYYASQLAFNSKQTYSSPSAQFCKPPAPPSVPPQRYDKHPSMPHPFQTPHYSISRRSDTKRP